MNKYKSVFNTNNVDIKYIYNLNNQIYKKSSTITINSLSNILKIYNGKFTFKKYVSIWAFGLKCGQLVWTKKKAKYKSKLKLKVKLKVLSQKKKQKEQKVSLLNQKYLYNRFKKIIIPKSYLLKINSNTKLR